jgi:hypothetical protein
MLAARTLRAVAAVVIVAGSSVAKAQTWQNITTTTPTGPAFWNNVSQDQIGVGPCNVGSILTNNMGGGLTAASCSNEAPANLLPLIVSPTPNQFLSDGANGARAFEFGAGSWQFKLLGTVTGSNPVRDWFIYDKNTNLSVGTVTVVGNVLTVYSNAGFYLGLSAFAPLNGMRYSNALLNGRSQFAAFTQNGVNGAAAGTATLGGSLWRTYYVGMEDNACVGGQAPDPGNCPNGFTSDPAGRINSDYDYNDMIISATVTPEPSTIALTLAGLVAVAAAARRRRVQGAE